MRLLQSPSRLLIHPRDDACAVSDLVTLLRRAFCSWRRRFRSFLTAVKRLRALRFSLPCAVQCIPALLLRFPDVIGNT